MVVTEGGTAFEDVELHEDWCEYDEENDASVQLLEVEFKVDTVEAAQPIHARRQRLDAHARLFNHVLALRKRECLGKMNTYIFCTLHDVLMREYAARGDSAESDDDY